MKFRKLKLAGFKSFVEPAEMLIEPGLTGIVGPNGCGKSNLLEALRWVMGENSSKSMRAAAMDDVIFSGSASRPPRQMAEVTLTLDNAKGEAPPPWHEFETLEVSRRIVREKGSTYRINAREVRARDVQLLFADAGSGARSPALVRQGRISELINAKPTARRRLLEEAAGITGLHTRRHEAELKLNAAQGNLARLEDVVLQLEAQVAALKRQARQAARYRELTEEIKRLQAALLWRQWKEASAQAEAAKADVAAATTRQAELVRAASMAGRELELLKEKIAPLRQEAAARSAAVQRIGLELESLGRQERAIERRRKETQERIRQLEADIARAREDVKDAEAAIARLNEERQALAGAEDREEEHKAIRAALQVAEATVAERLKALEQVRAALAEREATHASLTARRDEIRARLEKLRRELAETEERLSGEEAETGAGRSALEEKLQQAEQRLAAAASAIAAAEAARQEAAEARHQAEAEEHAAREAEEAARARLHEHRQRLAALEAEMQALAQLLGDGAQGQGGADKVLDALQVAAGHEKALAAALGEEAEAALDDAAPLRWRALPPLEEMPPLPDGAEPLSDKVKGPKALARRLASIGVVRDRAAGEALHEKLRPGQRLVSLAGDLWRWDGLVAAADAETPAERRLKARNRLAGLQAGREELARALAGAEAAQQEAREKLSAARAALQQAREAERAAQQRENEARKDERAARAALEAAREEMAALERARAEHMQQLAALRAARARIREQIADTEAELAAAEKALAEMPPADDLRAELQRRKSAWEEAQAAAREAQARLDALQREHAMRASRLEAVGRELEQWNERRRRAGERMKELEERLSAQRRELNELERSPEEVEERRVRLRAELRKAEQAAAEAQEALSGAEEGVREKEAEWRAAESELAEVRAALAGGQARQEAAAQRLKELLAQIAERMECRPELLLAKSGYAVEECPEPAELERALHTARAARERMGAVNLRAEVELKEAEEELSSLVAERDDVQKAIDKLRGAIASLNREGRKRLLEAFEQVNAHFAALFTTLFGGGKAHLELVESDDPLDAGLEIFAQPPGKRLQTLTLLSGGEQTLTALALIFAVFLVNPSPICVLDEVDAPLDEHNVERFCNLLDDMLTRASTDFLIITHHPLTMARMHRLYGVTMMEPGVSRLVSVDLQTAEKLREAS